MAKTKKQKKEKKQEAQNAFEKLNMKEKQFLLYWLGIEKPANGYDCYCNLTRSYFYAYYEGKEDVSIKKEITSVNDEGDMETKEVFTEEYHSSSQEGRKLSRKPKILKAKQFLRDEVDPVAYMKDLATQRSELGVAFRANKELMHIDGTTPTDAARTFTDFIKQLANDTDDE